MPEPESPVTVTQARATRAALGRHRAADDPAVLDATRNLEALVAERAIDDPVKLQRAARIVRTALARKRITLAELTSDQEAA